MIDPNVQKIVDESTQLKDLLVAVLGKLSDSESQIADLNAKIAAVPTAAPVDPENLAALVTAGSTLADTIAAAKAVVSPPAPQVASGPAAAPADAPAADPAPSAPADASAAPEAPAADPVAADPAPAPIDPAAQPGATT